LTGGGVDVGAAQRSISLHGNPGVGGDVHIGPDPDASQALASPTWARSHATPESPEPVAKPMICRLSVCWPWSSSCGSARSEVLDPSAAGPARS
jgi:hypothetical protein